MKRLLTIAIAVGCMFGVQQAASAKTHKNKSTASAKKHHKKHSMKKAATLTTLRAA